VRNRAWYLYLTGGVALGLLYFLGPGWARTGPVFNIAGISSVVAVVVGVRLHRPRDAAAWYVFAAGLGLFLSGDVITYNYQRIFHVAQAPFPSLGDGMYLAVYPILIAGIAIFVRRRTPGRDSTALVDALVITLGVGVVSWVFLMAPYANDPTLSVAQKLTSIAYPLGDLLLLGAIIRLAVGTGSRPPAFILLSLSIVSLMVTDTVYGYILITSTYNGSGSGLDAGWGLFYLLWGAAALHPSMRSLSSRGREPTGRLSNARLVMLSTATLVVPAMRMIQQSKGVADGNVPIAMGALMYVLVAIRMSGLVRRHEHAERRERALREAGAAFVAATDRDEISRAASDAIKEVAGRDVDVRIEIAPEAGTMGFAEAVLPPDSRADFAEGRPARLSHPDAAILGALGLVEPVQQLILCPINAGERLVGMAVITSEERVSARNAEAIEGLMPQASLAFERAELAENAHRQRVEARFRSLVQNATDLITVVDAEGVVAYQSPSVRGVLGYGPDDLLGTSLFEIVHEEDTARIRSLLRSATDSPTVIDARLRHRNGSWLAVEMIGNDLTDDPNVAGIVLNTRDVSERRAFEEQLQHQAFHDTVTGLANRALLQDRVAHALERQERDGKPLAVLLLDLDDFKAVNDSLGHAAGDRLLIEIGERLKILVRAADTVARMGGDEFAVLMEEAGHEEAGEAAERILEGIRDDIRLDGKEVLVRASVGIAIVEGWGPSRPGAEELLRNADVAMYMAKAEGKGRYQMFEPTMHSSVLKRLELKADLLRASDNDEFLMYYQPIYRLTDGELSGVEALIRWQHPEKGLVPPDQFIPLAEETGLIVPIGKWVMEESCREAVILQRAHPRRPRPITMSVNLSARQLQEPELVHDVAAVLRESGLEPQTLVVEITESVMMADTDFSVTRLKELKMLGVSLAVDDFGTGYSSLNYIRRFPIDILKVDKSFIDGIAEGGEESALTEAILQLAHVLNLRAVAEGIETKDQFDRLIELHCEMGQGYLFARPLEKKAVEALVASGRSLRVEQGRQAI
jgi:diguanylate cyclase (GGDEF)-like protein/PAS domain S-box-containing protein